MRYKRILKKFEPFYRAAVSAPDGDVFSRISYQVTAPILYSYVWWILREASFKNIKKIYFLARDGLVLQKIALIICNTYNLDIECKYLYCSRTALRTPSYHFIGDEAYDMLLSRGAYLSAYNILMRLELDREKRLEIYSDIDFSPDDELKLMDISQYHSFTDRLRHSDIYKNTYMTISENAFKNTIGYFRQEGIFDSENIVIADSGWSGSMQRSLMQLLRHSGHNPHIEGFYFGMFSQPPSESGNYNTWYFSKGSPLKRMVKFNNNVFECMCSADHTMTVSYAFENGKYIPVFKKSDENSEINFTLARRQIEICEDFAAKTANKCSFDDFDKNLLIDISYRLMSEFMYKPTSDEAESFGKFTFCDDVSETYFSCLAERGQSETVRKQLLFKRYSLKKHMSEMKSFKDYTLFWCYGSLALSDLKNKWFYRLNMRAWDTLRFMLSGR